MYNCVFFHGWASDHRIWTKVCGALKALGHNARLVNSGYLGTETPIPNLTDTIVIAHSLGVMEAYRHIERTGQMPKSLLSISGFTRFSQTKNFCGVKKRLLLSMKRTLQENVEATLGAFRKRANCTEHFLSVSWNKERLLAGLESLMHGDVRALHRTLSQRHDFSVFSLWGSRDEIVSYSLTKACFDTVDVVKNAGHFLPIENPAQCVDFIRKRMRG